MINPNLFGMGKITPEHFNVIAKDYDSFKKKYSYYYDELKQKVRTTVPNNSYTLDIGCGTGEMLHMVTKKGVGVDSSEEMVKLAQTKYPFFEFHTMGAENINLHEKFDVILMIGVAEHVDDFGKAIASIERVSKKGSIVLITTVHPIYRPFLTWAGKLGIKMDEGKHRWVPVREVRKELEDRSFTVTRVFNDLAIPVKIPIISHLVNKSILNTWFGLTQFVLAVKN
jgi:ubiquinone/menaquinone biosynthesis C-methylase UbiE